MPIDKDRLIALLSTANAVGTQHVAAGIGLMSSVASGQVQAITDRIENWTSGGSSTFKVISGDFQRGRAVIVMDGLKLRNRSNAFEMVPFSAIVSVQKLQSERRTSTFERIKGATAGSLVGGGVGAAAGAFAFMRTGPLGAAVGGTLGALLSVKHRYNICRITLNDERQLVAVAANTNWLALIASIPQPKRGGFRRLLGR